MPIVLSESLKFAVGTVLFARSFIKVHFQIQWKLYSFLFVSRKKSQQEKLNIIPSKR